MAGSASSATPLVTLRTSARDLHDERAWIYIGIVVVILLATLGLAAWTVKPAWPASGVSEGVE